MVEQLVTTRGSLLAAHYSPLAAFETIFFLSFNSYRGLFLLTPFFFARKNEYLVFKFLFLLVTKEFPNLHSIAPSLFFALVFG
jgi:hypothetical protein